MRLLITGALGFQGSHLAEYWLAQGHELTLLNTPSKRALQIAQETGLERKARVVWGSITDWEVVAKVAEHQDALVHLAAWANPDKTLEQPWGSVNVNVMGTVNILQVVRDFELKLLLGSSCEVYGSANPYAEYPQNEEAPLHPTTPYAAGKAGADLLTQAYALSYGIQAIILRPCNIYGPRQRSGPHGGVIPNFVNDTLWGRRIEMRGTGKQSRMFLYIDDLVRAYDLALQQLDFACDVRVFNVTSGEKVSIHEIYVALKEIFPDMLPPFYKPTRQGDVSSFELDGSRFNRGTKFTPEFSFKEGLRRYVDWARMRGKA
jgi:dTDP-glucose 4,6-dehydratase